jgi:hypothetical protein
MSKKGGAEAGVQEKAQGFAQERQSLMQNCPGNIRSIAWSLRLLPSSRSTSRNDWMRGGHTVQEQAAECEVRGINRIPGTGCAFSGVPAIKLISQRKGTGERRLVRDSVHPLPPEWFTTSARSLPNVAARSRTSSSLSVIIYLLCCSKGSQLLVFQHLYDHRPQTHNIHVFTRG